MQSYEPEAYIQLYSVLMLVWVAGYWKLTSCFESLRTTFGTLASRSHLQWSPQFLSERLISVSYCALCQLSNSLPELEAEIEIIEVRTGNVSRMSERTTEGSPKAQTVVGG